MAINRADGFGHFTSTTDWAAKGHNNSGANITFAATGGRGNRGKVTIGTDSAIHSVLTAAKGTVFAHVAFQSSRTHTQLVELRSATNTHIIVEGNEDGSFTVYRADSFFGQTPFNTTSATSLGTSDLGLWRAATWHHLMVKLIVSTTVGEATLFLDGIQVLTVTGANTYGGSGAATVSSMGLGTAFGVSDNLYSDLVIVDTDATDDFGNATTYTGNLGDVAVYEYVNPSDGDLLNWTRSSGAGTWSSHMNQNPQDGDTTYLSDAAGSTDEVCFFAPNVDTTIGTVLAVKETICHRKENAAFATIKLFYRDDAATNHYGPIKSTTTSYIFDELLAEVDPKDAAAWTNTRINNTQMGIRHQA